ncbi:hypothetical protein K1T71_005286 [Dendrolimus kikuchii]|uniref:Uncharacterized protein n=1 Tax=Dendrolimus kikuchii TaxID=765133 RepID=A0ACC1D769_9NEOP|nr:hypothetical protein K1T71_005286 [Dendrolimus kikuchii]
MCVCLPIIIIIIIIKEFVLNDKFNKEDNEGFSTSDVLVGKVMDFMYSNKTIMSLIARELWDIGSKAIDKIVELKGEARCAQRETRGPTRSAHLPFICERSP